MNVGAAFLNQHQSFLYFRSSERKENLAPERQGEKHGSRVSLSLESVPETLR